MAEIKKPETSTVKFLDKDCTVIMKSDGTEKITMRKADYESVLAGFGVTPEVREVVKAADDKIVAAAAKFQSDRLLAANKGKKEGDKGWVTKSELVLGGGDCCMSTELTTHKVHTGKDIKTGKPYTTEKFGTFRVTKVYALAQDFRKEGGIQDQITDAFTKAFGGKK